MSTAIPEELGDWIAQRRWFRSKTRARRRVEVLERIAVKHIDVLFVRVEFEDGGDEVYIVPIAKAPPDAVGAAPHAVIHSEGEVATYDALATGELAEALVVAIRDGQTFGSGSATLRARAGEVNLDQLPAARVGTAEQTNTAVLFGDRLIMKVYRRTIEGANPEVEILRFLARQAVPTPRLAGEVELLREGHEPAAVAVLSTFVKSKGDAWEVTLAGLDALLTKRIELSAEVARAQLLGRRTAELHCALASGTDPAFAPEPVGDLGALVTGARDSLGRLIEKLRTRPDLVPQPARESVDRLLAAAPLLAERLDEVAAVKLRSNRIRVHGDYHLGQVLVTPDDDFVIIDFEGEPARTLEERLAKASPLRDVAGMIRSFDYAAVTAQGAAVSSPETRQVIDAWRTAVTNAFVRAWREGVAGSAAAPGDDREAQALLDLFLIDKAVYEVGYELDNRPAWLSIPVEGLLTLVEGRAPHNSQ